MNSIATGRYISTDVEIPKGRYWEPTVITQGIPDHKNGHFIRPNKVALKYCDLKKMLIHMFMSKCLVL
jgi:hypothetical protein